ncbi:MAG: glutamine--tRNA ligase/YqeY domain fusion protein [Gemmataceae bacterium]
MSSTPESTPSALNFIEQIIEDDRRQGKHDGRVHTRFPPEPNGYLHIGHVKSICLNFGLAQKYGGQCNLRMDDTNPEKEDREYIEAIKEDVQWLGFQWSGPVYHASDYFDQLYTWAEELIQKGKAYVCDLSSDDVSSGRGGLKGDAVSPYRNRSVEENLDLFRRMKAGEFPDGARTLRAKIDIDGIEPMRHPNFNLRDPIMYRIKHAPHPHVGDRWCIYATYDWAHGQSDSIEKITHSICTLEFENHRPLYDWYIQSLGIFAPQQIEFAKLRVSYIMLSKRNLLRLVKEGRVSGWDDPRMPTIRGLRRRGYTPEALQAFCARIGVSKFEGTIDISWLEEAVRNDLNKRARRALAVLRPLKLVIDNYPEGQVEQMEVANNPEDPSAGTRQVPFSRVLYIEQEDFLENPPKDYYRLSPGREVRLRSGYFVTCTSVVKDGSGKVVEVHCTYDPATRGGNSPDGRKVKGTIHWVSAEHAFEAEVRIYDHLFRVPDPSDVPEGTDWMTHLNPDSLVVLHGCKLEPALAQAAPGERFQFERQGYFCADTRDSRPGQPVFNRTVGLRDSWAKGGGKK